MRISANTIDLIQTQDNFAKKHGPAAVSRRSFGVPIITMAHQSIGRRGVPMDLLPGIQKCLIHMAGTIRYREYVWIVPLPFVQIPFKRGPFGAFWERESLSLLVDSLILTILGHQQSLWESETNLAPLVLSDLTKGFERVCDWINRSVPIIPPQNGLVELIDPTSISTNFSVERVENGA